jgi:uncharacterized protein (TIGR00297 family)
MNPAGTFDAALVLTAVLAVVALAAGTLTLSGAVAGVIVGACVSVGFGLPGLAVLGTFFVAGSVATRIGWEKKTARGTAEAGEGRRDWKRVAGKGGVAAAVALATAAEVRFPGGVPAAAFTGAVAAALADTMGTEVGVLARGTPRSLPFFRTVATGTPGAVSAQGTAAAAAGAVIVVIVARATHLLMDVGTVAAAGLVASLLESVAVGVGLRAPGFVRNVLTTFAGAALGVALTSRAVV